MGRKARMKRARRLVQPVQVEQQVAQVRRVWLGKKVQFDLQQGYGVQYGRVVSISDDGDVFVECLPGYDRPVAALAFTLGYLHILTLVHEEGETASH